MTYNDRNGKPGKGGSGGVKKYPADKNFTPKGEHPDRERRPVDRKPWEKGEGNDRRPLGKPSRGRGDRPLYPEERAGRDLEGDPRRGYRGGSEVETTEGEEATAQGLVIGRNAVRELLRSERTVDKLLVRRGDREGSIVALVAEAVEKGIPVVEVDKTKLDTMAGFVPHQGVIAMVAQKEYCTVEDILALAAQRGEAPFFVIADGITDPYNLGALIRCAEGCGVHGLIIPRRRAVGLTALVAKASAGAIEHLAVAKVANIHQTILDLQREGIWVYAAEAGGSAHYDTDFSGPCALVMGSEGEGVSRVVKDACDGIVSIPMYGHVNSFNVSTAASVILAEIARQHHRNA